MRVHPEGEQLVVSDLLSESKPLVLQSVTFQRVELRDTVNGLEVRDPFDVRGDRWWSLHELLRPSEDLNPLPAPETHENGIREVAPGKWCGLHVPGGGLPVCGKFTAPEGNWWCTDCSHPVECHKGFVAPPVDETEKD